MLASAAVALGYVGSHALGLPMVWLDSALGTWSFGARPSSAAMDFFGRAAWAFGLAAAVAGVSWRVTVGERGARAGAVVAALAISLALGLEVKRLAGRVPQAEEFPAGYDPVTGSMVESQVRVAEP